LPRRTYTQITRRQSQSMTVLALVFFRHDVNKNGTGRTYT
jgi:hypothetical protein